jgi:hypothetical protein
MKDPASELHHALRDADTVTIPRAQYDALMAAAAILLEAYPNASEDVDDKCGCTQCRSERTVNALRTVGITGRQVK